jgi:pimeloyl-ACP methyl ester carboxylesterase
MSTLTLPDGRMYGYEQCGDLHGLPLFSIHGTPGGRLSRYPDLSLWERLALRVITVDRPGYGHSTPLPGRAVSHIAADIAAVADHLGLGRFAVQGGSGGGPQALATATLLGDRVLACAACPAGPSAVADRRANPGPGRLGRRLHVHGRPAVGVRPGRDLLPDPVLAQRRRRQLPAERDAATRRFGTRRARDNLAEPGSYGAVP